MQTELNIPCPSGRYDELTVRANIHVLLVLQYSPRSFPSRSDAIDASAGRQLLQNQVLAREEGVSSYIRVRPQVVFYSICEIHASSTPKSFT